MKFRKILIMALCLLAMTLTLASCEDGEIGSYLENYDWQPEVIEDVTLDFYIIVGEGTSENAMTTVRDKINQHLSDKYHTKLEIHYLTADEYDSTVATKNSGIVLITSKALMDEFMSKNALVDLKDYLATKTYGKLNTQITPTLLAAAIETDAAGKEHMYCIPNNHVIGNYEYIVIDKSIAKDKLNFNLTELYAMTTWESTEALRTAVETYSSTLGGITVDDVVKRMSGDYALRNSYTLDKGYVCNVSVAPQTTKDEVYSSAFAVLAGTTKPERAMEVIYAINTDTTLRNYLQYGVEHTNYSVVDGFVVPTSDADSVYNMNILYTGDIFKALYSNEEDFTVWTEQMMTNGKLQNNDAVVYEEPKAPESGEGTEGEGTTEGGGTEGEGTEGEGNADA